jgi:hypothetical protein
MSIGLEGALRTCKVDTGWASRIQSDRFENPNLMVCPVWNGRDLSGRPVCADSFYTKRAGCNSALDRVDVENYQRPQYMEYINLDAAGIYANIYNSDGNSYFNDAGIQYKDVQSKKEITGHFAESYNNSQIQSNCAVYSPGVPPSQKRTGYAQAQKQMGNSPQQIRAPVQSGRRGSR